MARLPWPAYFLKMSLTFSAARFSIALVLPYAMPIRRAFNNRRTGRVELQVKITASTLAGNPSRLCSLGIKLMLNTPPTVSGAPLKSDSLFRSTKQSPVTSPGQPYNELKLLSLTLNVPSTLPKANGKLPLGNLYWLGLISEYTFSLP